jgi:hypothetical protein
MLLLLAGQERGESRVRMNRRQEALGRGRALADAEVVVYRCIRKQN